MDMMKTTYKDMSAELLLLQAELQRQEDALLVPTEKVLNVYETSSDEILNDYILTGCS